MMFTHNSIIFDACVFKDDGLSLLGIAADSSDEENREEEEKKSRINK